MAGRVRPRRTRDAQRLWVRRKYIARRNPPASFACSSSMKPRVSPAIITGWLFSTKSFTVTPTSIGLIDAEHAYRHAAEVALAVGRGCRVGKPNRRGTCEPC